MRTHTIQTKTNHPSDHAGFSETYIGSEIAHMRSAPAKTVVKLVTRKDSVTIIDRNKQSRIYIRKSRLTSPTSKKEIVSRRKFICVKINNRQVKLQVDTASDITVISMELYDFLGRPPSVQCTELANSASGHRMSLKFEFDCQMIANDM